MLLKFEEEKNKELQQKIVEMKTDEGIEKKLREKFQIKKPGEQVVIILNPESPNNEQSTDVKQTFWDKILKFLPR